MIKGKKKSVIFIIIFLMILPNIQLVTSIPTSNKVDTNQSELPDLIGSVNIYEKDGSYWYNFSISNIGDAKADHYNITATVYPLGTFLFRNKIMGFIGKISPQLLYLVAFPFKHILRIYPYFIDMRGQDSPNPIYPGDTFIFDSWGPFDYEISGYVNSRICLILECIVDPDKTVKESNEQNNNAVIKWWFPLKNEPPNK